MVAAHPFLGDGWTQPLSTLTNVRNVGLSQSPRRPEGCLLAPQLHHRWTQVGSLSSRTRSKQVTAPGEGGPGVLPCFVATCEGDLGWPRQQPCWAWLRTVSGCFQKSPVWAAPTRPRFSRLRQPWGCRGLLRKGLEEAG